MNGLEFKFPIHQYNIQTLPKYESSSEALYDERETGGTHLAFQVEYDLCQSIKNGDVDAVRELLENTLHKDFLMGFFSSNPLKQAKYWSITVIATAIHYAILGGLDETDAYNLSDQYIRVIDTCPSLDAMVEYLSLQALALTELVQHKKMAASTSKQIKEACHYIHIHLHESLTVEMIAAHVGLSYSYFSMLFKQETGKSVHAYVISEKMRAAEELLTQGKSIQEICYTLGFCSQSHFTQLFKKSYHETPAQYVRKK